MTQIRNEAYSFTPEKRWGILVTLLGNTHDPGVGNTRGPDWGMVVALDREVYNAASD